MLLLVSVVSAEIIVTQQPNSIYNYGDIVMVPVTIKGSADILGVLEMSLICNGAEKNFYRNSIMLPSGVEKKIEAGVIVDRQNVVVPGFCKIKATLDNEYIITNDFKISDIINLQVLTNKTDFNPDEKITIEGKAIKENGGSVDGFLDLIFTPENVSQNVTYHSTISNGFFSVEIILPKETKSASYVLKLSSYEKNFMGVVVNRGSSDYGIHINQVPTSLELVPENFEIMPGESLRVKAILHDQSGEKIDSTAIISVKDSNNQLRVQSEKATGQFLEVPTIYNEPPGEWSVVGISNAITNQLGFKIKRNEIAGIKIVNSTLVITNKGNVPYNETLLVKIDYEPFNFPVFLAVDETRKYTLTAPDGEYYVEVVNNGSKISDNVLLTGGVVGVKEFSGALTLTRYPLAWIFVILILGFVSALFFRRLYHKSSVGYVTQPRKEKRIIGESSVLKRGGGFTLRSKNRAELSLSLKGDRQPSTLVLLKIKNSGQIKNEESEKALQHLIDFAEENGSIAYISEGYNEILFILAPLLTKTYKNEKTAVEIAKKINEVLEKYNKLARNKIDFGISINCGDMGLRRDGSILKFMGFGNVMNVSKKVASLSHGEVLLSEDMKNKIITEKNVERQTINGTNVYTIKEPRFKGDASAFIEGFKRRMEKK